MVQNMGRVTKERYRKIPSATFKLAHYRLVGVLAHDDRRVID